MNVDEAVKAIRRRESALWKDRSSWDSHAQDISDFLLPRGARFNTSDRNQAGSQHYNRIIDEAGPYAHGVLASGLMAGMTSPARPWFRLATPDRKLMEYAPVKLWLDKTTKKMLAIFAASNTYRAFHQCYSQLGAFGVGASVIVDNYDTVLHHFPQTFGSYALALDHWGKVDTLYRKMSKTVAQLVEEFGKENCSATVQRMYDAKNLDATVDVMHVIEPRRDRDYGQRDARNMPFKSCYLELGRDSENKYLRESGFNEFPALCPRWEVDGDDTYSSRWPAALALGSIMQLQQEQLQKSTAIDYEVDPPLQIPLAYKNQPQDRLPGGSMYVDVTQQGQGVRRAYEINLNLQHLLGDIEDIRGRVNRSFYVDLFLKVVNDQRNSRATAREIAEAHDEKLLMLGPTTERLHNEMLQPMIDITFSKMLRAGLFAVGQELEPPQEMQGHDLDVEYISVLAQAQRAVQAGSIDRYVGTIGSLSMLKREVLDKLPADEIVDAYADALGIDPSLVVADEQVALIRKDRAAQQQAMQAAAMAQPAKDMASAAKTLGETDIEQLSSTLSGYGVPGIYQ